MISKYLKYYKKKLFQMKKARNHTKKYLKIYLKKIIS